MKTLIKIFFDAACDNNSKFKLMGLGVAVFVEDELRPDLSKDKFHGTNGTNNIGEWAALELALQIAKDLIVSEEFLNSNLSIRIYGDSQIVVRQFNGIYRVRQSHFIPYYRACRTLYFDIEQIVKSVDWIPRERNKEADILSKRAIKNFLEENKML